MGEVYVVTSGKGGVGKSTTTANIGTGLALLGKKVLLIDTDIGLRNLDVVLGLENRIVYDLVDVATGICEPKQAILKDKYTEGLYLMPAAQTKNKEDIKEEEMKALCRKLKKEFDYVLIDCPAGIEQGFFNAIAGADSAIIVTTPEISAVRDADRVVGLLEKRGNIPGDRQHLVINRIRMNMVRRGNMMCAEDILSILAIPLLGIVPDDEEILIAANCGRPVVLEEKPISAKVYRNIARRLLGEDIPLLTLEKSNVLDRIREIFKK